MCIEEKVTNERASSPKLSCVDCGMIPPTPWSRSLYYDGMGGGGCLAVAYRLYTSWGHHLMMCLYFYIVVVTRPMSGDHTNTPLICLLEKKS